MGRLHSAHAMKKFITCAMFTAIIAVMAQLAIPMPIGVPVTLQTFAMALCGYILGWKYGSVSVFVYLLLGAVGVPVFANFKGGVGALFGMTGGYLSGFLFMVILCGIGARRKNKLISILLGLAGLAACHILGIIQFTAVSGGSIWRSFLVASLPYLIKDVVSVVGAYLISLAVCRRLREANLIE